MIFEKNHCMVATKRAMASAKVRVADEINHLIVSLIHLAISTSAR
jgi:hypothetical protein